MRCTRPAQMPSLKKLTVSHPFVFLARLKKGIPVI
jgi:hypothetical protein